MATSVLQAAQQMPGPVKEQKPFYSARSDRRQKASEFLEEHWKAEIDAGLIYRFHIQRYDPSLINALTYEFKGKPDELRRILPSKRDEVSRRYEELAKR
ncbi:MAG TPA: hypothetical protein DCL54_00935 [Alphaproteobacteria bacterium]|nr:hypothetical protein [Alphaproteobacteria bacterium]HAJ45131.1 hypothetical protein [Alphaproteobacteria bacterium]